MWNTLVNSFRGTDSSSPAHRRSTLSCLKTAVLRLSGLQPIRRKDFTLLSECDPANSDKNTTGQHSFHWRTVA